MISWIRVVSITTIIPALAGWLIGSGLIIDFPLVAILPVALAASVPLLAHGLFDEGWDNGQVMTIVLASAALLLVHAWIWSDMASHS